MCLHSEDDVATNSGESVGPLQEKWNQLISLVKKGEAENVRDFLLEEENLFREATNGLAQMKLCHPLCRCDRCRPTQLDVSKYLTLKSSTTGGRTSSDS